VLSTILRHWLLLIVIVMATLVVDQLSKNWVMQNLALGDTRQPIPALADYFQITHSANTGLAFGFFPQAGDLVRVFAVVVVAALLYFYPRLPDDALLSRIAISLIVGGALGNVLDRLQYDHVVDFIHYRIPGVISNVSNLADHAIVLGVLLILLEGLVFNRSKPSERRSSEIPPSAATSPDAIPAQIPHQWGDEDREHDGETPV
jgi:signal peptidase II